MAGIKDVFGYKRNPKPEGVFSNEESILTFGGTSMSQMVGYLVQEWSVNYSQQVQELFEIGSSALFWMKGRPQGAGSIRRIIGEASADSPSNTKLFPKEAYDLCDGGVLLRIAAKSGACGNSGGGYYGNSGGGSYAVQSKAVEVAIEMDGCVITDIGFQCAVADTLINETFKWRFAAMSLK